MRKNRRTKNMLWQNWKYERPYHKFARFYDLVYNKKDYQSEVNQITNIIRKYKETKGRSLLDAGCGTGNHLKYFKNYSCVGVDSSREMIDIAKKKKMKWVRFIRADIRKLNINKQFNVIISLFGVFNHLHSLNDIEKTIKILKKHLKEGGVLILELMLAHNIFFAKPFPISISESKDVKIIRMADSKVAEDKCIINHHHLVGEKGKKVKYFIESNKCSLFTKETLLRSLKKCGFRAKYISIDAKRPYTGYFVGI